MYKQFCRFIIERFFTYELKGESLSLLIDDSVIQDFCVNIDCDSQSFTKMIYAAFWEEHSSFECIIGIIAIEIYITSQRQADEVFSARAYNARLVQFLRKDAPFSFSFTENSIEKWYREHQDNYWKIFYDWCIQNDFYLVPKVPFKGQFRFVQYPLSFALLNKEDLSLFAHYFIEECNLSPNEDLSFQDFCTIIIPVSTGNNLQFVNIKNRYERIRHIRGEIVDRQLYSYYLRWDGIAPTIRTKKGIDSFRKKTIVNQYVSISDVYDKIRKYDRDWKKIEEIVVETPKKLFDHLCPFFDKSGTIMFVKDPDYPEFIKGNRIENDQEGLIMIKKPIPFWELVKYKSYCNITIEQETTDFLLIKGKDSPAFLTWLHKDKKPFFITGGLKLDRITWMQFGGPQLEFTLDTYFLLNGKKINIHNGETFTFKEYPAGLYRLKLPNWPTTNLKISKPTVNNYYCEAGWLINRSNGWSFTDISEIKGLDFSAQIEIKSVTFPTRDWINIHSLNFNRISNSKDEPIVNKQLKRNYNGTCNRIS